MNIRKSFDDKNSYYNELLEQKSMGLLFNFKEITRNQLRKLWYDEYASDDIIAKLFDVTKSKVSYKRKQMDINIRGCIIEDWASGKIQINLETKCLEEVI